MFSEKSWMLFVTKLVTILAFSITISFVCSATEYQPSSLSEVQAQYQLLLELKQEQAIDNDVFDSKTAELRKRAKEDFDVDITKSTTYTGDAGNRIDDFSTALYVISSLLFLALVLYLLSKFSYLLSYLSPIAKETFVYVIAAIGLIFFHYGYWLLLFGFLLSGVICYSIASRISDERNLFHWLGWPLTIIFLSFALLFDNSVFGFCCVLALLFTFKFIVTVSPDMIIVSSFENSTAFVFLLTIISFILSLLAWLIFYTPWLPHVMILRNYFQPFEVGMLTLFPLSYFFGVNQLRFFLLKEFVMLRVITELVGLASELMMITIALLYQLNVMFWIGALFLTWDFLYNFYHVVYSRLGFVMACGIFSLLFAIIAAVIKSNMELIVPYLSFLGV